MKHIINQLILIAGAWDATGQKDKHLESQFEQTLNQLANVAKTDQDGALEILLEDLEASYAST